MTKSEIRHTVAAFKRTYKSGVCKYANRFGERGANAEGFVMAIFGLFLNLNEMVQFVAIERPHRSLKNNEAGSQH